MLDSVIGCGGCGPDTWTARGPGPAPSLTFTLNTANSSTLPEDRPEPLATHLLASTAGGSPVISKVNGLPGISSSPQNMNKEYSPGKATL